MQSGFNTQPPEGGWTENGFIQTNIRVSTHSRPKAAGDKDAVIYPPYWFQHTAARRRLVAFQEFFADSGLVSTHSRPKAAGTIAQPVCRLSVSFNTQPPEGGWDIISVFR